MRKVFGYATPLLATAAVAAVIAAAPTASAADQQSCTDLGGATQCQTPGNVQIHSAPPAQLSAPWSIYGPFFWYDRR